MQVSQFTLASVHFPIDSFSPFEVFPSSLRRLRQFALEQLVLSLLEAQSLARTGDLQGVRSCSGNTSVIVASAYLEVESY